MNELTDKSFLNELLGQTSFNGIGIDVADMIEGERPPEAIEGPDGQMYANNVSIGPDGTWVSDPDLSEPVYFYTQGLELGDARGNYFDNDTGVVEQQGQWRTEAEIKEQWDADEGMGYFKQENPNLDFDTYMDFISESTALYNEGGAYAENAGAYQSLAGEYGIAMSYQNDDGDVFEFNGSNFTKTSKVDDSFDAGGLIMSVALSALAGPLAGYLSGTLQIGATAANAMAKSMMSLATSAMNEGELDFKSALMSAATSVAGSTLGLGNQDFVTDSVDKAESVRNGLLEKFYEAGVDTTTGKGKDLFEKLLKQATTMEKIKDIAGGTVGDIVSGVWNEYNKDRTDDVIPGDTTSEIVNDGTQNEDDEFEEDFGVDVDITGPQFPPKPDPTKDDTSGGGGGGGEVDGGGDPGTVGGGGDPNAPGGQYEVIKDNGDGTYTVKDNVDGDVWIIEGDYTVGDYIPEADMGTATGTDGDLDTGTNKDGTEDGSWVNGVWVPSVPTTPAPTPTPTPTPTTDVTPDGTGGDATTGTGTGGDGVDGDGDGDGDSTSDKVKDVVKDVVTAVAGTGTGTGSGNGNGDGDGDGDGDGNGNGDGMMSGSGDYTPQWGELFAYTTLTPYQKKALAPQVDYIKAGRGMLS